MTELVRLDDWRERFDAACDRLRREPFDWGRRDCALGLAGELAIALTGVDVAGVYRGAYASEAEALELLRRNGFQTIGDVAGTLLPEYKHPSMARIGDLCVIADDSDFGGAFGVVNGERVFVMTRRGLGTVDRSQIVRAFRIG